MLPLVNTLIILSGISAAWAGPLRRYSNTTLQGTNRFSPAHTRDPASNDSPPSSLPQVDGITVLPSSLLAGSQTELFPTSSALDESFENSGALSSTATRSPSFRYEPLTSDVSTASSQRGEDSSPTNFKTFDAQPQATTVTIWSTTWTTVPPNPKDTSSPSVRHPQQGTDAGKNTIATSTLSKNSTWSSAFIYSPIPTKSSPSGGSENTIATTLNEEHSSETTSLPRFSPDSGSDLPDAVTEHLSATETFKHTLVDDTTSVPGITIIPQNPSVIYITTTVTDPGVTTTVTA